jgi:glutamyl-tRNA reductase
MLKASKSVRTQSDLCRGVTSIGSIALHKASALLGGLENRKILLIGAGHIAECVAKNLFHSGCSEAYVCNRTAERAHQLAKTFSLRTWDYSDLDSALRAADVVICAVSSPTPILTERQLLLAKGRRKVVVVDLGVPPNFAPAHTADPSRSSVCLVEMEGIIRTSQSGSESRAAAVPHACSLLEDELDALEAYLVEREAAPYIRTISQYAEGVRSRNLRWALDQNPSSTQKERKLLEDLSIRIVRGMLEGPIKALKNEQWKPEDRSVVSRVFADESL